MSGGAQALPSVLVVGPAWVGDMVMAQSLLLALEQQKRAGSVDVLAPSWSLPLIRRMPQVREAIELPATHGELALCARWRVGRGARVDTIARSCCRVPSRLRSSLSRESRSASAIAARCATACSGRAFARRDTPDAAVQRFAPGSRATPQPPAVPEPRLRHEVNQRRLLGELVSRGRHRRRCRARVRAGQVLAHRALRRARGAHHRRRTPGLDLRLRQDRASGEAIAAACTRRPNLCGRTRRGRRRPLASLRWS